MDDIASLNLNKICRVCLSESEQMYSIYSELYEDASEVEAGDIPCIYEILISISSIKVQADDGLPSLICTKCIDMAHTSFKFQKQCNQSQLILDSYLKQCSSVKLEMIESDLSTLEQINKNDLVQNTTDNPLDPTDFLLVEDDIMSVKCSKNESPTSSTLPIIEEISNIEHSKLADPMYTSNSTIISDNSIGINEQKSIESNTGKSKTSLKSTKKPEKDKSRIYACMVCDKSYKYSNSLRVHMRNHTQERPYVCKTCGKSFKQYGSLVYHTRSHTGEQPYSCKICGKKYKQSGTLTAHMRIHTGVRPFLCSICGRGFRQAPDLGYHMRSHTKEKPYMCNVCGKTMSMQSHLVQHMRIHTGERPYKCKICEKAFPSSTRLKRHEIIHSGLKPYTCEVCLKSFNRMSSLKVHGKIHTDERSHVCPLCNKGFIQAHALKSHLVSHSSELVMKSKSVQYLV